MTTLIAKYLAQPTEANARKLAAYSRKHPMGRVLLDQLERGLLAQALYMASVGDDQ